MKFAVFLLTALVASTSVECYDWPAFGDGPLHDDIQYFLDLIPMEDVLTIIIKYAIYDPEFQEATSYVLSDEYKALRREIQAIPELLNFLNYLENNGVYIYKVVNNVNRMLGIEPLVPPKIKPQSETNISGGLAGLFNDIKALISYDSIIHGYVFKMKTSPAFVDFVAELKSPNFQKFIDTLYANKRFQKLHAELTDKDVNLAIVEDVMFVVLGISFPTQEPKRDVAETYAESNDLAKDFEDLAKVAITEEVAMIFVTYMAEDEEVRKAFEYAYTSEFHQMVREVEALEEYQLFVIYLHNAGLNIFESIQAFHKAIGMEDYVPPAVPGSVNRKYRSIQYKKISGGIRGMVDDIMAALPVDDIKAAYEEKLRTSKAFAEFIEVLQSPEFQNIVNSLYTHEVFLEIRETVKAAGLDLDALSELMFAILGITFPKP